MFSHGAKALFVSLCFASLSAGQYVPDAVDAPFSVRAGVFASQLPFETVVRSPSFIQRIGATDQIPHPGGGGRTVVTTLGGSVLTLDSSGQVSGSFLDLSTAGSVSENPDYFWGTAHGVTAMAFHPDYANPGAQGHRKFYIVETETLNAGTPDFFESEAFSNNAPGGIDGQHDEVLYEYTMSSVGSDVCDAGCAATKREVMRVAQPAWHHNIGDIEFDANNLLYISAGDGGVDSPPGFLFSNNSQRLDRFFGKIHRIDPFGSNSANGQYGIPASNPFADGPGGNVDEIYAYGLRNPYRLDFDPVTGDLFASETGEVSIESVNRIQQGGNHGWNEKEGSFLYRESDRSVSPDVDANGNGIGDVAEQMGLIDPVFEYDRDDGAAIIGGVFYRGTRIPELQGMYVFADHGGLATSARNGKLFYGDPATGQVFNFQFENDYFPLPLNNEGNPLPFEIHSVATDADGEITVLGMIQNADGTFESTAIRIAPSLSSDFDGDGEFGCPDVDGLVAAIAGGSGPLQFDLTADGEVDQDDLNAWLSEAGEEELASGNAFLHGDANLDGVVDGSDFNVWNSNKFTSTAAWCSGDFNADGVVDGSDFNIWNANKFTSSADSVSAVPEPQSALYLCLGVVGLLLTRRNRCQSKRR